MLWIPERRSLPELMDLPHDSYSRDELEGALNDLALMNNHLGNGRAVLKHLVAMNAEIAGKGISVLDVATGTVDIPVAIAKWARQAGIRVGIKEWDFRFQGVQRTFLAHRPRWKGERLTSQASNPSIRGMSPNRP